MLAFFRNDMGFGGNNGFTDFKDLARLRPAAADRTRVVLRGDHGAGAGGQLLRLPGHRRVAGRPGDSRDPRRREPHALPRLPRRVVQALGVRVLGGRRRRRRRALRAAGRHHQPERVRADQLDRGRHLGGGRRPRHAATARRSARCSSTTPRRIFTGALPEVWLYALGALFVLVTLFLPRGLIGRWCRRRRARHDEAASWPRLRRVPDARRGDWRRDARGGGAARAAPAPRQDPLPRAAHRQLRRLQGAQRADALRRSGRAALHHRPERRRQDDDDGRHHRQDAPGRGLGVVRPQRRPADAQRARDRAGRHRPQVPEADGVRAPDGVREPRAGAGRAEVVLAIARRAPDAGRSSERIDEVLDDHRPRRPAPRRAPVRCRTARSSGSRSACC